MVVTVFRSRLRPGVAADVQQFGRERFYAAYRLQVCRLEKEPCFP